MREIVISGPLSYLPSSEDPLSADVGILRLDGGTWLFDLGAAPKAAEHINALPGKKRAVISHFHKDHCGNLGRVELEEVYAGAFTVKKLGLGVPVTGPLEPVPGLRLFPIPSSHAKGCLGLCWEGYAFLGDAVYAGGIKGRHGYNAGLLRELILTLRGLEAKTALLSHRTPPERPMAEVIGELEEIYSLRTSDSPYIFLDEN